MTSIVWEGASLKAGLRALDGKIHARLTAVMDYNAKDMEAYAKTHASWKDQTSNARNGLMGRPEIAPLKTYAAVLSHSVPYGIWLEVRWAGKYAIIMPTIRQQSPKVAAMLRGMLNGL